MFTLLDIAASLTWILTNGNHSHWFFKKEPPALTTTMTTKHRLTPLNNINGPLGVFIFLFNSIEPDCVHVSWFVVGNRSYLLCRLNHPLAININIPKQTKTQITPKYLNLVQSAFVRACVRISQNNLESRQGDSRGTGGVRFGVWSCVHALPLTPFSVFVRVVAAKTSVYKPVAH